MCTFKNIFIKSHICHSAVLAFQVCQLMTVCFKMEDLFIRRVCRSWSPGCFVIEPVCLRQQAWGVLGSSSPPRWGFILAGLVTQAATRLDGHRINCNFFTIIMKEQANKEYKGVCAVAPRLSSAYTGHRQAQNTTLNWWRTLYWARLKNSMMSWVGQMHLVAPLKSMWHFWLEGRSIIFSIVFCCHIEQFVFLECCPFFQPLSRRGSNS